jgi:hypothetical protein
MTSTSRPAIAEKVDQRIMHYGDPSVVARGLGGIFLFFEGDQ